MENQEYNVKQIWPAHADHISHYKNAFLNDLFKNNNVVVQRKYDGERMLIHFNRDETYCTSRRTSKKTGRYMENQDKISNLPHLNLGYTVIDCEFYGDTWADAVGILHSLPERALQLQENTSIKFAVFDCLFFDGTDVRDQPYEVRLQYVHQILSILNYQLNDFRFHFVEQFKVNNVDEAYVKAQEQWNEGHEGVVMKPLGLGYYDKGMMLKIKRFETLDVVVCGYQEGRGKYEGLVGALYVGYWNPEDNNIVKISKVNCGTDEDRKMWKKWFDEGTAIGKVIEVKCQEVTDKSLRHPVYMRLREDKAKEMCTKETIFKGE